MATHLGWDPDGCVQSCAYKASPPKTTSEKIAFEGKTPSRIASDKQRSTRNQFFPPPSAELFKINSYCKNGKAARTRTRKPSASYNIGVQFKAISPTVDKNKLLFKKMIKTKVLGRHTYKEIEWFVKLRAEIKAHKKRLSLHILHY